MSTAVVFDFGGVLFRWQPQALLREHLAHRATDEASAAHWATQIFQSYGGDWAEFDRGAMALDELVARTVHRTGLGEAELRALLAAVPAHLQPLPGSVALLEGLHAAGVPLYYLSNMPAPTAAVLHATHGFLRCFRSGVFSSDVGHNKPSREIFEIAAARFGHAPGELLFLDDHGPNIEAAQALGWQGHVFTGAPEAAAELRRRGLPA